MRLEPFAMERWQSTWEHRVAFNLSESGVHPLMLDELLELTGLDPAGILLGYTQSDGSERLKERIAALYPGAAPGHVIASTGGAEANYVALWSLVSPGDRVVVIEPAYGQAAGLARGFGAEVVSCRLEESLGWQPQPGAVRAALGPGARLLVVTNPSNPTGAILSREAMEEIVEAAAAAGAWILADEVYAGAEVGGALEGEVERDVTPSFWGRYERVIVSGSLSKAYGLPGLRIGWLVAPEERHEALWSRKDYTTIAPSALSDAAAERVLAPAARRRVLARTRRIIRDNLALLRAWLDERPGLFRYVPPAAGAILYLRYALDVNSSELAERLRVERDVLVVPGDHFGMDRYLRIGFGNPAADLEAALGRIASLLETMRREAGA